MNKNKRQGLSKMPPTVLLKPQVTESVPAASIAPGPARTYQLPDGTTSTNREDALNFKAINGNDVDASSTGRLSSTAPDSELAEPPKKKRRITKCDSSETPKGGRTWPVLRNSLKLGREVTELEEDDTGTWMGGDAKGLENIKVARLEVENCDETFDIDGEDGVSRRRLFGRVSSV